MSLNQADEGKPKWSQESLDLAQKLKDELDRSTAAEDVKKINKQEAEAVVRQIDKIAPANSTLLELQKQATAVQRSSELDKWSAVTDYDYRKIPPPIIALMYKDLGLGTLAQCLALALERYETGKNPLKGHIYILPSGRIGTSLEGMEIDLKREGVKLGKPKYEDVTRPWRKGIVLKRKEDGRWFDITEKDFDGKEPGKTCRMMIDDEPVEYTCWLTEWFMGGNPNWWNRMPWMLEVRAKMNCIKLGSGLGISEEIVDTDNSSPKAETTVKAPKETPFGGK